MMIVYTVDIFVSYIRTYSELLLLTKSSDRIIVRIGKMVREEWSTYKRHHYTRHTMIDTHTL